MRLPTDQKRLIAKIERLIEECFDSADDRASQAQRLKTWAFTGSGDGDAAIYNRLDPHIDRMASYLFSPVDLRFHVEFEDEVDPRFLAQADRAGQYLSKQIEKADIDIQFSAGVEEALRYGAAIQKVYWTNRGLSSKLIMHWNFGVSREDLNTLDEQECMVERMLITKEDLWRRIAHLPNAQELYRRAITQARKNTSGEEQDSFFRQVILSGSQPSIMTDGTSSSAIGGAINSTMGLPTATLAPSIVAGLIKFYELTILDDERGDYTTLQYVAPDILITQGKRSNFFVNLEHPYTLIQPNRVQNYLWGVSEIAPLIKLQALLRERLIDIRKIMGMQYDKLLAFLGFSGITDEAYDRFRESGFISEESPSAKIEDLTPRLPDAAFAELKEILSFMDDVAGFQSILSGQSEPGVRSQTHAATLMKTASPRLRDRAILVERQCSELGNKAFSLLSAKEAKEHLTPDGDAFLLSQLPENLRIAVDSHSSSPIYEEDHKQLAIMLKRMDIIDGETVLDLVHLPMRDLLKARYRKMQKQKQEMIAKNPQLLTKGRGKGIS